MQGWGWRIPFLMAAPIGLVGLYLRLRLDETPSFRAIEAEQAKSHSSLRETVITQWRPMLRLGAFISLTYCRRPAYRADLPIAHACQFRLRLALGLIGGLMLPETSKVVLEDVASTDQPDFTLGKRLRSSANS